MNLRIKCNPTAQVQRGMTLIEIMIVVVIIGVLAAIVYPSYTDHVLKSHRTAALADMSRIQLQLEKDYTGSTYVNTSVVQTGNNKCKATFCQSDTNRYAITVTVSTTGYTITATAQSGSGQTGDDCLGNGTTMTLNEQDVLSPSACKG